MSEQTPAGLSRPTKGAAKKTVPANNATSKKTTSAKPTTPKKTTPAKKATSKKTTSGKPTTPKKATSAKPTTSTKRTADAPRAAIAPFTRFFKKSQDRARRLINDPEAIREAAERATKSSAGRSGPFANVVDDFRTIIRLCVAYSRGHYRDIPPDQLVIVLGGLIYVVSPLDLIPDVLPGGFVDDAFVVGWVVKTVRSEIDAFREWELGSSPVRKSGGQGSVAGAKD
jgi:uncharacterized membrane protein YkvA (DUF1232 family)